MEKLRPWEGWGEGVSFLLRGITLDPAFLTTKLYRLSQGPVHF